MNVVNSLCSVYAELLENEISKPDPDRSKIKEYLEYIKTNCHALAAPKGNLPEQLEPYLIKKGECAGQKGTTIYKGKRIPKVAKCIAEKHGSSPKP